jgi:UDP-2-acetamido-3-amino-2,3-dideoxy-glucuronate N-acetyltransferase
MTARIHPTAGVETGDIGEGTVVWQYCVILKGARIGKNCNINFNVFIENDVIIGDDVTIKPGVQLWDGLRVGNGVFIGPNATFTNDLLPRSKHYPGAFAQTIIEQGASIGANATIISGITIGSYSMVGAGSVITKDVPPFTLWYGNPARHKGYVTRSGTPVSPDMSDKEGRMYILKDNEPVASD